MGKTKTWQKVLATLLSVVLVLVLLFAPLMLSALSLLTPESVAKMVTQTISKELFAAQGQGNPVKYILENLPEKLSESDEMAAILEDVLNNNPNKEALEEAMESDAVKEFVKVYTEDLTNSLTGKLEVSRLDAEKIRELTKENMDDFLQTAEKLNPELTESDLAELESSIIEVVDENAEDIVAVVPAPGKLKEELAQNIPGVDILLGILENKTLIMLVTVGLIVLLSAGVILCLLHRLQGFRSLAVSLLVGGGFNALICIALWVVVPMALKELTLPVISSALDALRGAFVGELFIWTAVLLLSGGALLTAYLVIKKLRVKKTPVMMEEA